jgi:fumarylacetoacetate (FAA) hydrolase
MAKGLGVLQCKPASSFSPVAVTPQDLGKSWKDNMLCRPVSSYINDVRFGDPWGHIDAYFDFPQLIAHLARTRDISAGSIIGVGTVANRDEARGTSCILERRALEIHRTGAATTPYMKYGDRIRIESLDEDGLSIFGAIDQTLQTPAFGTL